MHNLVAEVFAELHSQVFRQSQSSRKPETMYRLVIIFNEGTSVQQALQSPPSFPFVVLGALRSWLNPKTSPALLLTLRHH